MQKKLSLITTMLIAGTFLIWIPWDIYVEIVCGTPCSESAHVAVWAYFLPSFCIGIGALMGHFFAQKRAPSTRPGVAPKYYYHVQLYVLLADLTWGGFDFYSLYTKGHGCALSVWVDGLTHHVPTVSFLVGMMIGHLAYQMSGPLLLPEDSQ